MEFVVLVASCVKYNTKGTTLSGPKLSKISFGTTSSVILDLAKGAMMLDVMLLLYPSLARVSPNPINADLARE
ncbi:hypothetical protein WICPIJ_002535 [Wickerhamomyces pijperi]|uniref:Uncharacterized protein n=1 Tax=Wickerhamomyces pijperi TaxID=599730 RepID=A0A9P8TQ33_WICPI|nr:hypothetical protein WICPIJ_002535 [Wickerhamomyces pijperi]